MSTNGSLFDIKLGYRLRLANGQRWHILAGREALPWLEKFASIMELKAGETNGEPRLIFRRGKGIGKRLRTEEIKEQGLPEVLPERGWKKFNLRSLTLWYHTEVPHILCDMEPEEKRPQDFSVMWQALFPIHKRAQDEGGLPVHAALVERDGRGVLLAAAAETGKSTCCRRIPSPWRALSDDEALVVRNAENRYRVHPFPSWGNYIRQRDMGTWDVEQSVPLSAILFLEQAESDEAVPIGQARAAELIFRSSLQGYRGSWLNMNIDELRRFRTKLFENACDIALACPAFRFRVSLNGRFWKEIEKVLA